MHVRRYNVALGVSLGVVFGAAPAIAQTTDAGVANTGRTNIDNEDQRAPGVVNDAPRDERRQFDRRVNRLGYALLPVSQLDGMSVSNYQGEDVGDIVKTIVNRSSGQIVYYVLAHGGFATIGTDYFAVPPPLLCR